MRLELKKSLYTISYPDDTWWCIADVLRERSDWIDEAAAIIPWADAIREANWDPGRYFPYTMPAEWIYNVLKELMEPRWRDELPGNLVPSFIVQIRKQNRRR